jgi:hypothetical protein
VRKITILVAVILGLPFCLSARQPDTSLLKKDTAHIVSVAPSVPVNHYTAAWDTILKKNIFLNTSGTPLSLVTKPKKDSTDNSIFYLLAGLVFTLALIKFFFDRYFSNLFRVFFNTSLRQSQLADQLLQAKLPSLLFNAFFVISGGFYVYFLLVQYKLVAPEISWVMLLSCVLILAVVYIGKYSTLKFTGWVTGYSTITDTYVFIIFLIAKIIGILVIPFMVLMAFATPQIAGSSALISLLLIGLLLLLRFFRSYGLIQNQLKVSRFHFFLYIIGVEIVPLLLIYKGLLLLLTKNQ